MNTSTTLQIPISNTLKREAKEIVKEQGFSSLQDFVRLVLTKLVRREITVSIQPDENIQLNSEAKLRYKSMEKDFKSGRNIFKAKNADDFLRQIRS